MFRLEVGVQSIGCQSVKHFIILLRNCRLLARDTEIRNRIELTSNLYFEFIRDWYRLAIITYD